MLQWLLGKKEKKEKCTNCGGGGSTGDMHLGITGIPCRSCGGSGEKSDQDRLKLEKETKVT